MHVMDCMRAPAITCAPDAKMIEVARQMEWSEVGSVVVTDIDEAVLGIVTDRDLVYAIARELGTTCSAADMMAKPVMVIHESEDVYDAAAKMAAARCRRLPVLNTAGKLVGVVAIDDIVGAFSHRTERGPLLPHV